MLSTILEVNTLLDNYLYIRFRTAFIYLHVLSLLLLCNTVEQSNMCLQLVVNNFNGLQSDKKNILFNIQYLKRSPIYIR